LNCSADDDDDDDNDDDDVDENDEEDDDDTKVAIKNEFNGEDKIKNEIFESKFFKTNNNVQQQFTMDTSTSDCEFQVRKTKMININLKNDETNSILKTKTTKLTFNSEQLECICECLIQSSNVKKVRLLLNLLNINIYKEGETLRPITNNDKEKSTIKWLTNNESILKCRAIILLEDGKYRELYNLLESRQFSYPNHNDLQVI
jgi:hypothetical protein